MSAEKMHDYGTITCPDGKRNIEKSIVFTEHDKRQFTCCLTESDEFYLKLESNIGSTPNIQAMFLTRKSFVLMQFAIMTAVKKFGIDLPAEIKNAASNGLSYGSQGCGDPCASDSSGAKGGREATEPANSAVPEGEAPNQ